MLNINTSGGETTNSVGRQLLQQDLVNASLMETSKKMQGSIDPAIIVPRAKRARAVGNFCIDATHPLVLKHATDYVLERAFQAAEDEARYP